jgi:Cu+-exporting ATPase
MHPEVQQQSPGSCPICGMALEPMNAFIIDEDQNEFKDTSKRFWLAAVLSTPLLLFNMGMHFSSSTLLHQLVSSPLFNWFQLFLASPAVLWGGWPFWQKAWASIKSGYLNMFTLIGLGVGVAYFYSLTAIILPPIHLLLMLP